jgi:uncharacterized membrane protein
MNLRCYIWWHELRISTESRPLMLICTRCGHKFKVIQAEGQRLIDAPLEKVYGISANYEDWPKFFPYIESARLVSDGSQRVIESVLTTQKGKKRLVKVTQRLVSSTRIEEEVPIRNRKWMSLVHVRVYERVQEGTRLTLTEYVQLRRTNFNYGIMHGIVKKFLENRLQQSLQQNLDFTKKAAETKIGC